MKMNGARLGAWATAFMVAGIVLLDACSDGINHPGTEQPGQDDASTVGPPPALVSDASTATPGSPDDAANQTPEAGAAQDATADAKPATDAGLGVSSGCGKAPPGVGLQDRTITINGKSRPYLRYVPETYDRTKPLMLVVSLAGSGGTRRTARGMGFEAEANSQAVLLYPEALPDSIGQNRWQTEAGSEDYALFDALVAEAEATYCIDRNRLFVAGYSLGARFTSMLGCFRGDRIRAIAAGAPGVNRETLPLDKGPCVGKVALWAELGIADIGHAQGSMIVRDHYRVANGCSATRTVTTPSECEAYQGCGADLPVHWCTHPLGHTWPAFAPGAIMSFFRQFR